MKLLRRLEFTLGLGSIVACLYSQPARASTYFVSLTGVDDPARSGASADAAWKTVAFAMAHVESAKGHVIHIGVGTYQETSVIELKPGVSLQGAGVQQTTLVRNGSTDSIIHFKSGQVTDGQGLVVSDLTLDGGARKGPPRAIHFDKLAHYTLSHLRIKDFSTQAIHTGNTDNPPMYDPPPYPLLEQVVIEDMEIINCGPARVSGGQDGSLQINGTNHAILRRIKIDQRQVQGAYGIKAVPGWNKGLSIIDCDIAVAGSFAIELFNVYDKSEIAFSRTNASISLGGNKYFSDYTKAGKNGDRTIFIHHNDIANGPGEVAFYLELQLSDVEFAYNHVVNPGRYGAAVWTAGDEKTAAEQKRENHLIHHNVYEVTNTDTSHKLARIGGRGVRNVKILNNTAYKLPFGIVLSTGVDAVGPSIADEVTLVNNIFVGTKEGVLALTGDNALKTHVTVRSNVFEDVATVVRDFGTGQIGDLLNDDNTTGPAGLVLTGAKPDPFFRPLSSSPVVNHGIDVGLPFVGAAPDIGAYEFGGAAVTYGPGGAPAPGSDMTADAGVGTDSGRSDGGLVDAGAPGAGPAAGQRGDNTSAGGSSGAEGGRMTTGTHDDTQGSSGASGCTYGTGGGGRGFRPAARRVRARANAPTPAASQVVSRLGRTLSSTRPHRALLVLEGR